jgi:hypothetical protein
MGLARHKIHHKLLLMPRSYREELLLYMEPREWESDRVALSDRSTEFVNAGPCHQFDPEFSHQSIGTGRP